MLEEGKGVHRYALVDKDTLRGIAGRYQQTGDTSSGTDSLGDVKRIIQYPEPPGYRITTPLVKPKIGPFLERIAQIIDSDKSLPKKQRHTAKRIYERIQKEGYQGKYTQVKEPVREIRRVKREMLTSNLPFE